MRIVGEGAVAEVLRGVQVGRARQGVGQGARQGVGQGAGQGGGQGAVGGGQVEDCLKKRRTYLVVRLGDY